MLINESIRDLIKDKSSMSKNAVIYLNSSSGASLERKEVECRNLARQHGVKIQKVFTDTTRYVRMEEKEGLWLMHKYCFRTLDIGFVFVFEQDDLARNNTEWFFVRKAFKNCGVEIVFVHPKEQPNF